MKIWIDFTNTPHVNFLKPIITHLQRAHILKFTARDFSETLEMLSMSGIDFQVVGKHLGKSRIKKSFGILTRIAKLAKLVEHFDISISIGGQNTTPVSFIRRKPAIVFSDNDIVYKYHSYKFGKYFIFPSYYDASSLRKRYGISEKNIFVYYGYKEDVYIADYQPDPDFLSLLPFKEFITIRPENLKASYVPKDAQTIVPQLFERFKAENILFLPRFPEEKEYARGYGNIFIPDQPLNGLDVCYYTKCMLTGAGTFAREAAILGTPAVTFFPGKKFLTVDQIMIKKGMEFKSRDVDEIHAYVKQAKKNPSQKQRSREVQKEVFDIIDHIIELEEASKCES